MLYYFNGARECDYLYYIIAYIIIIIIIIYTPTVTRV